jgi:hypothetical protein
MGFVFESLVEDTLPRLLAVPVGVVHLGLLAVALTGARVLVRTIRQYSPTFLRAPAGFEARDGIGSILGWSICAYVVVSVVLGTLSYGLVPRTDEHWVLVVIAFSLWVPLFFAVPIGATVAWFRTARHSS